MKAPWKTTVLGATLLASTACGAIFNGTRQTISATSTPAGTEILVDLNQQTATTPAFLSLERKNDYNLTFSMEGYTSGVFHIQHSINGGILVLDILTGLIGVIVDAATGAWFSLSPSAVQVTLHKTAADAAGPDVIRVGISRKGDKWHVQSSVAGVTVDVKPR